MPPLFSKKEMDVMSSVDESDTEPISTEMLEYICGGSQSHTNMNRRDARYNICDCIKQSQVEWKGALLRTQNMGKGLHSLFKAVGN